MSESSSDAAEPTQDAPPRRASNFTQLTLNGQRLPEASLSLPEADAPEEGIAFPGRQARTQQLTLINFLRRDTTPSGNRHTHTETHDTR